MKRESERERKNGRGGGKLKKEGGENYLGRKRKRTWEDGIWGEGK